jgi:hypothetical protein
MPIQEEDGPKKSGLGGGIITNATERGEIHFESAPRAKGDIPNIDDGA